MKIKDLFLLLVLSSIWGASFLFMRVAAPEFGAMPLVFIRMAGAVVFVLPLLLSRTLRKAIRTHLVPLAVLGFFNHVVPFSLLSFAMTRLEAGFTSVLNATTPIFAALIGAAFFAMSISRQQTLGLVIAIVGVAVLSLNKLTFSSGGTGWAILAVLGATTCYGIAVNFSKQHLSDLSPSAITLGSMSASAVMLVIPALFTWPEVMPSTIAWAHAISLAVLSTAIAFLLFFRILASSGAFASSTVTLLVPLFATWWGVLFLSESLTWRLAIGMVITLLGTAITLSLIKLKPIRFSANR